ncbi:hypothetical protein KFK09_017590 [Dendrobium nobile]|uniref:DUF5600 domain-containing protein n=1 Tax=Dendrobium nobile TaxID=94219 RepID=A0A8T3B7R7_DENNO|nr:hypothetical protein KFK09_017590 [Dendrobium nobile]
MCYQLILALPNRDQYKDPKSGKGPQRWRSNGYNLKINEFVKRARAVKIHAYIISHLKKEMPAMMGKAKTQQRLINNLQIEFEKVDLLKLRLYGIRVHSSPAIVWQIKTLPPQQLSLLSSLSQRLQPHLCRHQWQSSQSLLR